MNLEAIASKGEYSEIVITVWRTGEGRYRIVLFDKHEGRNRPWGLQADTLEEAKELAAKYVHDYEHDYKNRPGGNPERIAPIVWSN